MTRDDIKQAAAEGAREAVREVLDDHESRINTLEAFRDNIKGGSKFAAWLFGALLGLGGLVAAVKTAWGAKP